MWNSGSASLTSAYSNRGEQRSIVQRRQQEDSRLALHQDIQHNSKLTHKASWEHKTSKLITNNQIQNHARVKAQQSEQLLQARRQKLAELLASDDQLYRQEIVSRQETSTQKAKRLILHARKLKEEREERRQRFAEEMREKQWRNGCDDLRTLDGEYYRLHINQEVINQQNDKKIKKSIQQQEEAKWAEIWERDRLKKVDAENEKAAKGRQDVLDNRQALNQQISHARQQQLQDKLRTAKLQSDFQKQMQADAEQARQRAEEELDRKRKHAKDTAEYNAYLRKQRKDEEDRLKADQKREVGEKMEEYRQDTQERANQIAAAQREIREFKEYLQQRREEESQQESEMERLVHQDLSRENAKRDMQWEKERLARENLVKEVYDSRLQQIKQKEEERRRMEEELILEMQAMELELEKAKEMQEQEEIEQQQQADRRRVELEHQIELNNQRRQIQQLNIGHEHESSKQAEQFYRERLGNAHSEAVDSAKRNYGIKSSFKDDLHNRRPF